MSEPADPVGPEAVGSGRGTLIRAELLVAGTDEPPLPGGALLVEDGRITAVGPAEQFGTRLTDGSVPVRHAGTLLPGLVDCHAHPTLPSDRRPIMEALADGPEMAVLTAVGQLGRHLRAGYTTVRDCGAPGECAFALRRAAGRGHFASPRLLITGPPVSQPGGHLSAFGGAARSEAAIRAAVERLARAGVDAIKVVASGGSTGGDPTRASYTTSELAAAVQAAHEHGLRVVAHCRASESISRSAQAGIDVIAHAEFLPPGEVEWLGGGGPTALPEFDPVLAELVAASGALLDLNPHSSGWDTLVVVRERSNQGHSEPGDAEVIASLEAYFERMLAVVSGFRDMGLAERIAFGSDAGPWDTLFGHPEYELQLGRLAGLDPLECIQTITRNAARVCDLDGSVGTLEPGKQADMLDVTGDPLVDPTAIRRVRAVYLGGRLAHAATDPTEGA